jgi:hypothetical protein
VSKSLWGREKQRQGEGEIELLVAMGDQITIVSSLLGEQELAGEKKNKERERERWSFWWRWETRLP